MKIKRQCLYLLLFLFVQKMHSQSSFFEATVIKNNDESIQGFIEYENWEVNPEDIVFKKKLTDKKTIFLPTQIKAFMVNGDLYESHKVKLEEELKETANESPLMGFKISQDTIVFLRCHVKGYLNLYSHTSNGKSSLYTNKAKDTLQLLVYRRAAEVSMSVVKVGMLKVYKKQLKESLYDYPELSKKITKAEYTVFDIQNIVSEYNKHFSNKAPITYVAAPDKGIFTLNLLAGGNYSFLSISSEPNLLTSRRVPDQTIKGQGLDFGISAQYFLARGFNSVSIVNDLVFKTMSLSNNVSDGFSSTQTTFDNSYLRLYSQVRYRFIKSKEFEASVNGGFAISYAIKKDNSFSTKSIILTNNDILFPEKDYNQLNVGLTAGLLFRFNKAFALEIRGETNNGMSLYNSVSTGLSSLSGLISYRLY
jgi:hypothetical protein